jgi:hypothetical protein
VILFGRRRRVILHGVTLLGACGALRGCGLAPDRLAQLGRGCWLILDWLPLHGGRGLALRGCGPAMASLVLYGPGLAQRRLTRRGPVAGGARMGAGWSDSRARRCSGPLGDRTCRAERAGADRALGRCRLCLPWRVCGLSPGSHTRDASGARVAHPLLEIGGALGRPAGPVAQPLELASLHE